MILQAGEKIHIIEKILFLNDIRKHFCGIVIDCTETLIRAKGYVWVLNTSKNEFIRKEGEKERIFSMHGHYTINIIPMETRIEKVKYSYDNIEGHRLSDGKIFNMNFIEFGVVYSK